MKEKLYKARKVEAMEGTFIKIVINILEDSWMT
jgi:hypothetical protein